MAFTQPHTCEIVYRICEGVRVCLGTDYVVRGLGDPLFILCMCLICCSQLAFICGDEILRYNLIIVTFLYDDRTQFGYKGKELPRWQMSWFSKSLILNLGLLSAGAVVPLLGLSSLYRGCRPFTGAVVPLPGLSSLYQCCRPSPINFDLLRLLNESSDFLITSVRIVFSRNPLFVIVISTYYLYFYRGHRIGWTRYNYLHLQYMCAH